MVLLKRSKPCIVGQQKSLARSMSNSKRAHTRGPGEASAQAFLACMLLWTPALAHLGCKTFSYLPSRSQARWKAQEAPKQSRASGITCTPRHPEPGLEARQRAGMLRWSCCRQHPPTPPTAAPVPPATEGQTCETKPRTAAGEGWMQRQESQGLFTSHAAVEPQPESPFLTCGSSS